MSQVINLRQARKAKKRNDDAAQAASNRLRYGRTAGQRHAEADALARANKVLDGAKRQTDDDHEAH